MRDLEVLEYYELGVCGDIPGKTYKRRTVSEAFSITTERVFGANSKYSLFISLVCEALPVNQLQTD